MPKPEKLKRCPFGCALKYIKVSFWSSTGRYGVACHAPKRRHTVIASGKDREEAVAAWNRRPDGPGIAPAPVGLQEAFEAVVADFKEYKRIHPPRQLEDPCCPIDKCGDPCKEGPCCNCTLDWYLKQLGFPAPAPAPAVDVAGWLMARAEALKHVVHDASLQTSLGFRMKIHTLEQAAAAWSAAHPPPPEKGPSHDEELITAVRGVCWFDWEDSELDDDAHESIKALRRALARCEREGDGS